MASIQCIRVQGFYLSSAVLGSACKFAKIKVGGETGLSDLVLMQVCSQYQISMLANQVSTSNRNACDRILLFYSTSAEFVKTPTWVLLIDRVHFIDQSVLLSGIFGSL